MLLLPNYVAHQYENVTFLHKLLKKNAKCVVGGKITCFFLNS